MVSCTNGVEGSCTACGTTKYKCHHHTYDCPSGYQPSAAMTCPNGKAMKSQVCSCGKIHAARRCYKCK